MVAGATGTDDHRNGISVIQDWFYKSHLPIGASEIQLLSQRIESLTASHDRGPLTVNAIIWVKDLGTIIVLDLKRTGQWAAAIRKNRGELLNLKSALSWRTLSVHKLA